MEQIGKRRVRIAAGGAGVAGLTALALAGMSSGAAAPRTPARDAFTGRLSSGTRAYAGDSGQLSFTLAPAHSAKPTRSITISLTGASCAGQAKCLKLRGKLHGTITAKPSPIADLGQSFTLALKGTPAPLGAVKGTGTLRGTGFIARGRERARIRLSARHGTVTITARSAFVSGFTSA